MAAPACLIAGLCIASANAQAPPAELELIQLNDSLYVIHNEGVPGNATALVTENGRTAVVRAFSVGHATYSARDGFRSIGSSLLLLAATGTSISAWAIGLNNRGGLR